MNKTLFAASLLIASAGAFADDAATPPHQLSGTVTAVSDYIFRGMTQTWHRPALQASLDYAHASGVFASLWTSTVSDRIIAGAHAEIDVSLGYRGTAGDGWQYGAGLMSVFYPGGNWNRMRWGDRPDKKYDFTDANAFVGYRAVTVKYSRTLNDLFGFSERTGFSASTRGSTYVEINADVPLADTGWLLGLHAGRQDIRASVAGIDPDSRDYRIALARDLGGGWNTSLQLTWNTNKAFLDGTRSNRDERDGKDIGKRRFALAVGRTF